MEVTKLPERILYLRHCLTPAKIHVMNPTELKPIQTLLWGILSEQAAEPGLAWVREKLSEFENTRKDRTFYLTFSAIPRYLGKQKLTTGTEFLKQAESLRSGFTPKGWATDRMARVWLLLHLPHEDTETFLSKMEMLFDTADMRDLEALYSSLPLLPFPERFTNRAAEGVRTNITNVFDAVALNNPYPADYLDEGAWNQMVLKAAFLDRPIFRIYGLEKRANFQLAQIISDYAHERWAAGRVVSPEFWRPIGRFVDKKLLSDIERLFAEKDHLHREAAALVCAESDHPMAKDFLKSRPQLQEKIQSGILTWDQLAQSWWARKSETSQV